MRMEWHFSGKLTYNKNLYFVFSKPGYNTSFNFSVKKTVLLHSPGGAESADFFLRILNSLSLLGEFAEWQLAHYENARNEIKRIWRKRPMEINTFGECGEFSVAGITKLVSECA